METTFNSSTPLQGRRVLVTGGSTGIGREIVFALATQGARIALVGRNQEQIDETIAEAQSRQTGAEVSGVAADLSKKEDIDRIFSHVETQLGGIDILVNNAALAYQSVMDGGYDDWSYIIHTNVIGYLATANAAVSRMDSTGHILNIGSMSADVREKDSSVYVATKSAIQGFSEALRKEVNPKGIRVTLIEPGAVDTDMQSQSREEKDKMIEEHSMLQAVEIARAVVFCLSQPPATEIVDLKIKPNKQFI